MHANRFDRQIAVSRTPYKRNRRAFRRQIEPTIEDAPGKVKEMDVRSEKGPVRRSVGQCTLYTAAPQEKIIEKSIHFFLLSLMCSLVRGCRGTFFGFYSVVSLPAWLVWARNMAVPCLATPSCGRAEILPNGAHQEKPRKISMSFCGFPFNLS